MCRCAARCAALLGTPGACLAVSARRGLRRSGERNSLGCNPCRAPYTHVAQVFVEPVSSGRASAAPPPEAEGDGEGEEEKEPERIDAAVTDHGDGTYTAIYSVPAKGNYEVGCSRGGRVGDGVGAAGALAVVEYRLAGMGRACERAARPARPAARSQPCAAGSRRCVCRPWTAAPAASGPRSRASESQASRTLPHSPPTAAPSPSQLNIEINGEPMEGSPFPLFFSAPIPGAVPPPMDAVGAGGGGGGPSAAGAAVVAALAAAPPPAEAAAALSALAKAAQEGSVSNLLQSSGFNAALNLPLVRRKILPRLPPRPSRGRLSPFWAPGRKRAGRGTGRTPADRPSPPAAGAPGPAIRLPCPAARPPDSAGPAVPGAMLTPALGHVKGSAR